MKLSELLEELRAKRIDAKEKELIHEEAVQECCDVLDKIHDHPLFKNDGDSTLVMLPNGTLVRVTPDGKTEELPYEKPKETS